MVIGILIPLKPLIIFTFLLCFYDIFSVFITKHMMEFVKYAKEQNAAMLIETKEVVYKKGKKIETSIAMGTGDIVIPSAVSISALSISVNTAFSFLVASLFGYWVVVLALYALKRPLPALPFVMLPQFIVFLNYFVL
jgi:presenilin-like A22 family membrane protease